MKKIASLLLMLAITMSLCVPVFAGTPGEDMAITRFGAAKEAVLLLWYGKTDSEIQAQLQSYHAQQGFADVTEDEGYLKAAKANGIIAGFEDGTFRPDEILTYAQAAKMVVCALGYDTQAKENGGYPSGYIAVAKQKGLIASADASVDSAPISPDTFSSMIAAAKIRLDAQKPKEDDSFVAKLMSGLPQEQSTMISPFSIKMAMAMAANGAEGDTQKEICTALGIDDLDAYNGLAKKLIDIYSENKDVTLNVANSIWLNTDVAKGAAFSEPYQKLIGDFYSGKAQEVTNENAVKTINDWISEKTNGKIKDVLSDSDFLSALVNTIYFKGEWLKQFNESATKEGDFTDYSGKKVTKQFMNKVDYYGYFENDTMQAVKLAYKDRKTSMYILLPKEGQSADMPLEQVIDKMDTENVNVKLPKFKVEFSVNLNDILKEMGVKQAFDSASAKFTPMFQDLAPDTNPYISSVLHKTYIDVDENGTEAAAATAVIVGAGSAMPTEEKEFTADRPFSYYICDDESAEVLFAGKIVD